MKKLIAMLTTALCAVSVSLAQETVTGVVVDKKGNPLPGVRIEVPGTPDQAISDLDGSFTLFRSDQSKKKLFATYAGMNPRKVKIKDGMRIKMKEYNWWTQKPDEWNWMVNAIFAVPNETGGDIFKPAYGLMVGRVKNFGYYLKGVTNTFGKKADDWESSSNWFIEDVTSTYWSVTGGALFRLGCPIYLNVGVGYADYKHYVKGINGEWYNDFYGNKSKFVVDLGLMLKINHVNIYVGYVPTRVNIASEGVSDKDYTWMGAGNFGIGYSF